MMSSVWVRLGGVSPMAGVLGCRATGCSAGIGRAGKVEEMHFV